MSKQLIRTTDVVQLSFISPLVHHLVSVCSSLLLRPADRQLREQVVHGHGGAAAVPRHPGVHGAQQSGSLPQGGARDHDRPAHPSPAGVSRAGNLHQWKLMNLIAAKAHFEVIMNCVLV